MATIIKVEDTVASVPIEETYKTPNSRAATELVVVAVTTKTTTEEEREQSAIPMVMEESGDDLNNTITLVTPSKDYLLQARVLTPVQETSPSASAELVC